MSFFDIFKKKPAAEPKKEVPQKRGLSREELDAIANYLRETTAKPVVRVKAAETEAYGPAESRFGGYPYREEGEEYPHSSDGKPLYLLAQINFSDVPANFPLPKEGLLQFFIASDDLYGLGFKNQAEQDRFRVIFRPSVDPSVTVESVKAQGTPANTELNPKEDAFPFYKAYSLTFTAGEDAVNDHVEDVFDDAVQKAAQTVFGEAFEGPVYKFFSNEAYDELCRVCSGWGHKMFGYPAFTQADPRRAGEYDTLLLQIDSEGQDLMWGDSGICNFFISGEKLKAGDFSDVLYNWDCY